MVVPNTTGIHSSQVKDKGVQWDDLTYVIDHDYLNKAEEKRNKNKENKKIGGTLRKGTTGRRKLRLDNNAVPGSCRVRSQRT